MVFFLSSEIKGGYLRTTNPLLRQAKSPLAFMTRAGAYFWQYLQIRVRAAMRLRVKLFQTPSTTRETSVSIIDYA